MENELLSDEYLRQAFSAYDSKNYKLCLILLRNVVIKEAKSAALIADCAYEYWKIENDETTMEAAKSCEEKEEILHFVKESFSLLLSKSPHDKIKPYDYIRLTHIYLVEGSLDGALQIMKLASARGHLLNSLIIIQSWTILKRVGNQKDAESCLQYLSSSISMEPKSTSSVLLGSGDDKKALPCIEGSAFPLSYALLHCTIYIKRRMSTANSKVQREKDANLMKSMITEAYIIQNPERNSNDSFSDKMAWYNDPELWMEMAEYLATTPFLLLSEDSYWEAFIRQPISNKPLKRIVHSLQRYHRKERIPHLLAKAYEYNPWSLYTRKILSETEVQYATRALAASASAKVSLAWNELFRSHFKDATKVQAQVRSWIIRSQWPSRKARLLEIKAAFLASIDLATENAAKLVVRWQVTLLRKWRQAVVEILQFKNDTATKIETCWRRKRCMLLKERLFHRVRRANALYIVTCQNKFDMARLLIFRRWMLLFEERRKHKGAAILVAVIPFNTYRMRVKTGLKRVLPSIIARQRRDMRDAMSVWSQRYRARCRNHARITIRFFVRASFTRQERERQRLLMLEMERKVQQKTQELVVHRDFTPLLREMWATWRAELQKIYGRRRWLRAVRSLTTLLPMLHARKIARYVCLFVCIYVCM